MARHENRGAEKRPKNPPAGGLPPESVALSEYYKKSGLTAADLAAATGLSVGSIRIALSGVRYRQGEPKAVVPPDPTVAKLASALGIEAHVLRRLGRDRAAEMLVEGQDAAIDDLDTKAAIAGRRNLARQVLALFSTEEIKAELRRRDAELKDARQELDQLESAEAAEAELGVSWSEAKQERLEQAQARLDRLEEEHNR